MKAPSWDLVIGMVCVAVSCVVYAHATFVPQSTYDRDIRDIRQGMMNIYRVLTSDHAEVKLSETDRAWLRAVELGKPPAGMIKPAIRVQAERRYLPTEGGVSRLCGNTEHYLVPPLEGLTTIQMNGLKLSILSEVDIYMRADEPQRQDIMTHEFLHAIWLVRANLEDDFYAANPESEAWVVSLVPTECPE